MAGFGWNSRHGNTHGSKRPILPPSQIACRICDHVFMNTQALIDHIESHMVDDDIALRRHPFSSSHTDPFANPLISFSLSTPTRTPPTGLVHGHNRYNFLPSGERNRPVFSASTPQNIVSGAQPNMSSPQAQLSWLARRNKYTNMGSRNVPLTFPTQPKVTEESHGTHCTRPFLQQLDKPLHSKVGFQEMNGTDHRNRSDVGTLDLTLKL